MMDAHAPRQRAPPSPMHSVSNAINVSCPTTETIALLDTIPAATIARLRGLLPAGMELTHGQSSDEAHLHALVADADYIISVARTTGSNAIPVAEFTIGLMISVLRNLTFGHMALQGGEWRKTYRRTA